MRQTLEQQEKSLRWLVKNRWLYTGVWLFGLATMVDSIFQKRLQWPFLISFSLPPGVPILHSIWENIFGACLFTFIIAQTWVRIYNYRRDLLLAEQMALQKAAQPPEGVWPPPPIS